MKHKTLPHPILVIGAGLAGLTAASTLKRQGFEVVVLEKSRGAGGRMASRRGDDIIWDHGANYFSAHERSFVAFIESLKTQGLVKTFENIEVCGFPYMSAIPRQLSLTIDLRKETKATAISYQNGVYSVGIENQNPITASALVITSPVPQSLALINAGGIQLQSDETEILKKIEYNSCISVMAELSAPPKTPALQTFSHGPLRLIIDNQKKGISKKPSATIQASPEYSKQHFEEDRNLVAKKLIAETQPHLGVEVISFQVHGWRYSQPISLFPKDFLRVQSPEHLYFAGDAFKAPSVEGAYLSGLSAAHDLIRRLEI